MTNKETQASTPAMNPNIVNNIKHVVVLMLENRSFDHVFGNFPGTNGITPSTIPKVAININTQKEHLYNPHHDFSNMMKDIFGPNCTGYVAGQPLEGYPPSYPIPIKPTPTASMNGFLDANGNTNVMSYFQHLPPGNSGRLNVLHSLAENYVVCDNFFCDTPSCTTSNRFFVHAATNKGYNDYNPSSTNTLDGNTSMFWANTIFQQLDTISLSSGLNSINWACYGWPTEVVSDSEFFNYCYGFPDQYTRNIKDFPSDVANGKLPFYTFLNPSTENTMHPSCDVRHAENYVAQVYNTLAESKIWENTLLIITFDENGGFYDHVPPPKTVSPDGINYCPSNLDASSSTMSDPAYFDYSILGPRIPALLISPWLTNSNAVSGGYQVDSTQYQNTSIPRFVQDLFQAQINGNTQIGAYSMNKRDAQASSFANSPFWRNTPLLDLLHIDPYTGKDFNGKPIWEWGQKLMDGPKQNWPPKNPDEYQSKPSEFALDFAKEYLFYIPGHKDSGKEITKKFKTSLEWMEYVFERKLAAQEYVIKNKNRTDRSR